MLARNVGNIREEQSTQTSICRRQSRSSFQVLLVPAVILTRKASRTKNGYHYSAPSACFILQKVIHTHTHNTSRDNAVGVTGLRAGRCRGSNLGRHQIFFSSPKYPDWLWGSPSLLYNGYLGPFLGLKRPGR